MAVGSNDPAKRGVLITRLSAAEDAATMNVLCVDKTGTITMNQLSVTGVIPLENATEADVLLSGALASQEANQNPIDLAFLAAAKERKLFDGKPAVTSISDHTAFDEKVCAESFLKNHPIIFKVNSLLPLDLKSPLFEHPCQHYLIDRLQ
jgi:cation transport ATPase